jgi:hypothetical protein
VKSGITASGKLDEKTLQKAQALGYTIVGDDHYRKLAAGGGPARPLDLSSPSSATRDRDFGCFKFTLLPLASRHDREAIVIKGSCDGTTGDWTAAKIVSIPIPQLRFASGYTGEFRCHAAAEPVFRALFISWEEADLLHLVISYSGCFVPRYMRGIDALPDTGHGAKLSRDVGQLSNHAFGSAFDINVAQNPFRGTPADWGMKGCVKELVPIANRHKVYWGGHFPTRVDGMHFEIAAL